MHNLYPDGNSLELVWLGSDHVVRSQIKVKRGIDHEVKGNCSWGSVGVVCRDHC
jgi:hypothetical protein